MPAAAAAISPGYAARRGNGALPCKVSLRVPIVSARRVHAGRARWFPRRMRMIRSGIVLAVVVAMGCAAEVPAPEATSSTAQAVACEPYDESYCDPAHHCEVWSRYVTCSSGVQMYAWDTPDCRYCIPRDACPGEYVCPF